MSLSSSNTKTHPPVPVTPKNSYDLFTLEDWTGRRVRGEASSEAANLSNRKPQKTGPRLADRSDAVSASRSAAFALAARQLFRFVAAGAGAERLVGTADPRKRSGGCINTAPLLHCVRTRNV